MVFPPPEPWAFPPRSVVGSILCLLLRCTASYRELLINSLSSAAPPCKSFIDPARVCRQPHATIPQHGD